MTEHFKDAPPQPNARTTGAVYLLYFLTAICGELCMKGLVVSGDPAATAHNILAHESAFRSGLAVGLVANVFYIALTVLLYDLFRPVNRSQSLLAAFFSLMGCAVQIVGGVFRLAPLVVLGGGQPLSGFTAEQWQVLAMLFLKLHVQAFNVGLVFFAFYDLLLGWLICRSGFLPRVLGVLMMLAGLGWLVYLWPPLAVSLARSVQPLGFLAELALMLWLLVRGVDAPRWHALASTAGKPTENIG